MSVAETSDLTVATPSPSLSRKRERGTARWAAYGVVLAVLLAFPFVTTGYPLTVLTEVLIFGLFAMSLDVILGYTGMPSFGHAAFFGLGA